MGEGILLRLCRQSVYIAWQNSFPQLGRIQKGVLRGTATEFVSNGDADYMKPRENGTEDFVMTFPQGICDHAIDGLKTKRLQPRDLAVLMAVLGNVNWRSGRAKVTPGGLALQMGILRSNCVTSISRLRKELLISRVVDPHTGENYYLINPRVAAVGGSQRRGHLWAQFESSLE